MINFVARKLGKVFRHIGIAGCFCTLRHVLVHLCAFDELRRHRVHEVFVIALRKTVELGVLLEVLLVLVGGAKTVRTTGANSR